MRKIMFKSHILLIAIVMLAFIEFSYAVEKYEIVLDDGQKIETLTYWEEDNKVFYEKFGSSIGIAKTKVVEINVIQMEQGDTQDSYDSSQSNYSNWDEDAEKKKVKLQAQLTRCEKKLLELKNTTMEYWERYRKSFNKANKKNLNLDEYIDQRIGRQERRCAKYRKRISNTGVLDLAEVDLCKYTTQAKAERVKHINEQKNIIQNFKEKCMTNRKYCHKVRNAEKKLELLLKEQANFDKKEIAFAEKLNINLEEEANKNAF